jgi:hypothetical protein
MPMTIGRCPRRLASVHAETPSPPERSPRYRVVVYELLDGESTVFMDEIADGYIVATGSHAPDDEAWAAAVRRAGPLELLVSLCDAVPDAIMETVEKLRTR